ncbi:DUF1593 domain-containing protein [Algoriphagus chordae]|uniref:Inosine-uridine preferring nucleoside hydrolase n=1 Tax=Algoriphagus chordae TaxID=237019 RepID=A0A2W7QSV6_9BACT|nr:DUF1593 domain-containing protein [Algoriphagus chordae]PZX49160.1 inosine-uridine preferring nucleoside hydrolase [Algoriphagus chordae]
MLKTRTPSSNTFWVQSCMILICMLSFSCDAQQQQRVIISTDIGGSDPDDYQSLVHLLLYADTLDIVGLVSSPPYEGRKEHILEVIDAYEQDYPELKLRSKKYPSADYLRSITAQGALDSQQSKLPDDEISEGAQLIIDEAKKEDNRPLYILVWGSITDIAQALNAAPEIKPNIRVYSIGSWNTTQDTSARNYVYNEHSDLWFIESNSTFRGMYMGGFQDEDYGNLSFVNSHVKGFGALGELFYQKKTDIKMGDTPSFLYLLNGNPSDPESESWGGQFEKTDHGRNYWTDIQDPAFSENNRQGAKTVNKWRKDFLNDWKLRMSYLK